MLTARSRTRPHPEVVCTELRNGDMVLLHLESHTYYTINETGTLIWRLMSQGMSFVEIGHRLEAVYQVNSADAQLSVTKLAQDFIDAKLVLLIDESDSGCPA